MDETVRRLGNPDFFVTAIVAPLARGHRDLDLGQLRPSPRLPRRPRGQPDRTLGGPQHPALGTGDESRAIEPAERQLRAGERLLLLTDGVLHRRTEDGGAFGVEGLRSALDRAESPTAAATAMAIQQAVADCWAEPLEDDATIVVLAVA